MGGSRHASGQDRLAENPGIGRACMGELVTHGSDFRKLQEAWAGGFMTGVSTTGLGCRGG